MAEEYVYAVTRVHAREQSLLRKNELEQLADMPSVGEALSFLGGKGWEPSAADGGDFEALTAHEIQAMWRFIAELGVPLAAFGVFRVLRDFHNLKAAIKIHYANERERPGRYMMPFGSIEPDALLKAAGDRDFSRLPDELAKAGQQAQALLFETGSGQGAETAVDRAALMALDGAAKAEKNELLKRWALLTIDKANVNAAMRCCAMGKSRAFAEAAIAPAGTLDYRSLTDAAAGAGAALPPPITDDDVIEMIRPERAKIMGLSPIAAYVLAKEGEARQVGMILSGKASGALPADIKGKVGLTYV